MDIIKAVQQRLNQFHQQVADNIVKPAQNAVYNWGVQNPQQTSRILQSPKQIQQTIARQPLPINNITPFKMPNVTVGQVGNKLYQNAQSSLQKSGQLYGALGTTTNPRIASMFPRLRQTPQQQELLKENIPLLVGNIGGFTKPQFSKFANYLSKTADKESINKIMDFVIDVQKTGGKRNYGQLGQEIQSMAHDVFGKKNVEALSNKQLANLFDNTLKTIGQGRNNFNLGLSVGNIRKGQKPANAGLYDIGKDSFKDFKIKLNGVVNGSENKTYEDIYYDYIRDPKNAGKSMEQIYKELKKGRVAQPTVSDVKPGARFPVTKPVSGESPQAQQPISKIGSDLISGLNTGAKVTSTKIPQLEQTLNTIVGEQLSKAPKTKAGFPVERPQQSLNNIIPQEFNFSKLDKLYQEAIDRYHPISKLGKQAGQDQQIRNALTGHYGAGSIAKYHVDYELAPILKSINIDELRNAAIAQRDIELSKRGIRGSNLDIKAKITPNVSEALKKLYAYQDGLVKTYLVDTGIMSKSSYIAMKANNQSYVPFRRIMDKVDDFLGIIPQKRGVGSVGSQNVIKNIKGSNKAIEDPLESIVENTYKLVGLGQRQKVAKAIIALKKDLPDGMIKEFRGVSIGNDPVISVFEDGKVRKYLVPREVAEAAKGLNEDQLGMLVKIFAVPTKVFRATATSLNPEFMIPNIVRDAQSAFVNFGVNPMGFVQGLAHMLKGDAIYQEFLRSGGLTSIVSIDRPMLKATVKEIAGKGVSVNKPSDLLRLLQNFGAYSEQPTRIAAFQKAYNSALKAGKSIEEARSVGGYAAQEATVNFARRGAKTQSINAVYAFLNARAQGIDRLARSIKADPVGAPIRLGMIVLAPGLATYAWNQRFKSYYDERIISKNDKQNNFIIMLSDEPINELGGAQYIKIPKGDIGRAFNPVEAYLDFIQNKGNTTVKDALYGVLQGFSPITNIGDIVPTSLRPIVEDKANKNFFFNTPIVPEYLENEDAKNQFRSFTPALYRWAGAMLNVSPARLQNLTEGYGTGWAKIASMLAKPFISEDYQPKDKGAADINTIPIARRILGGAKYSEDEAQKIFHFKNATEAQTDLSNEEKAFIDSLRGAKDPNDPIIKIYKYTGFLRYPATFSAYQATAVKDAKGNRNKIDPLYLAPYDQARRYMLYEMQAPGSVEGKALLKNYPDIVELMDKREKYFDANPIRGEEDAIKYDPGPQADDYTQQQMDAKNWKDPKVQEYLNSRLIWRNNQRAKLGLLPQDKFGNIYGTSGYNSGGLKKLTISKISARRIGKIKVAKPKKVKLKRIARTKSKVTKLKAKPKFGKINLLKAKKRLV